MHYYTKRENAPRPYYDGFDAVLFENATGQLVYNPHDGGAEHDWWDTGYQDALDATRQQ